jgi:predicted NUDIX family phosphoesterase
MNKKCFVVEREQLEKAGFIAEPNGYKYTPLTDVQTFSSLMRIMQEHGSFRDRFGDDGVENDEAYKQIIPYIFVLDHQGRFLAFQRSTSGAEYHETRLKGKISLGIGGHIDNDETFDMAMLREFDEEAQLSLNNSIVTFEDYKEGIKGLKRYVDAEYVGIIDDESTPVDRAHLGIAARIQLSKDSIITVKKGENTRFWYLNPQEYVEKNRLKEIETERWSEIVFEKAISKRS